MTTEITKW